MKKKWIPDKEYIPNEQQNYGQLPEVTAIGYKPIELITYYPFQNSFPYTGHSKLKIPITKEVLDKYGYTNPNNNSDYGILTIDKKSYDSDYNLLLNNCSDATLKYLNTMFGTKEQPFLYTTPGNVQNFAIDRLKGKLEEKRDTSKIKNKQRKEYWNKLNKDSDTVKIFRTSNNADILSERAINLYRNSNNKEAHLFLNKNY